MTEEEARYLLARYRRGECSKQEREAIEAWIDGELKRQSWNSTPEEKVAFGRRLKEKIDRVVAADQDTALLVRMKRRRKVLFIRLSAVACIILAFIFGKHLVLPPPAIEQQFRHDIVPGGDKATLTLADGKQVVLTGANNGKLGQQGNAEINNSSDGYLSYNEIIQSKTEPLAYNVLTTPPGGQYRLRLVDGTIVWLNAASSIKYPTAFPGTERQVVVTGEAYFDVSENAGKPFIVKAGTETIQVLGTQFNVKAYSDEPSVKTTLVEGSVKITGGQGSLLLKAGQQTLLQKDHLSVVNANVEEAVAWKNGYFRFNSEDVESIMRKLARWYNIEVRYEGPKPTEQFSGTMSRSRNISEVLDHLSYSNSVHFRVDGRIVTVSR